MARIVEDLAPSNLFLPAARIDRDQVLDRAPGPAGEVTENARTLARAAAWLGDPGR